MRKAGKKYTASAKLVDKPAYPLSEAMPVVKKAAFAKFDETVEVAMRLGVDPKHADQMVRGTVVLPHGLGKTKRVIVIASGDKVADAREASRKSKGARWSFASTRRGSSTARWARFRLRRRSWPRTRTR